MSGQAIGTVIGQRDRLLHLVEGGDGQHRAEDLLAGDFGAGGTSRRIVGAK
jgi:hypothetical protein